MAARISSTDSAFTSIAASPAISLQEVPLEVITGIPQAIASAIGNQKPSCSETKTSPSAL